MLVVDDEAPVRDLIARWLSSEGYLCATAATIDGAWRYLQAHEVQLVTADIAMPGESGLELLTRTKDHFPDTEVIMLTGVGDTRTAIESLTQGACGYLLKPVEREELLIQARRALERRHLLLERRLYTLHLEETVRRQTAAIRRAHEETIHRLVKASQYRDEETGAHIRRTGLYSEVMAEVLGWPSEQIEHIRLAAPMHDVGKIGVPDAILQKPGKLTPEEYEIMQSHAVIGARLLSGSESPMLQMAERIALCHHERWDGTGYPAGLWGEAIPECARIVAIVDVYDALTHDRVYRQALPEDEALAILERGRGTHFDPFLLGVFLSVHTEMQRIARANPDTTDIECLPQLPCLS
jgi:putative two-component system response regulator